MLPLTKCPYSQPHRDVDSKRENRPSIGIQIRFDSWCATNLFLSRCGVQIILLPLEYVLRSTTEWSSCRRVECKDIPWCGTCWWSTSFVCCSPLPARHFRNESAQGGSCLGSSWLGSGACSPLPARHFRNESEQGGSCLGSSWFSSSSSSSCFILLFAKVADCLSATNVNFIIFHCCYDWQYNLR